MVDEEIITGLKNAVDHGDSLESAIQIMINSGYNPAEVRDASRFIGGVVSSYQVKPEEELTMPSEKKGFFKKAPVQTAPSPGTFPIQNNTPLPQQNLSPPETSQKIREDISVQTYSSAEASPSLAKTLEKIGPPKPSHLKEIILLIVLLLLVGVLIVTIVFRDNILSFFSG